MSEFIFVVGVGRSGTTLLQSMLHAHSQICFSKETHFIKRFVVPEIRGERKFDSLKTLTDSIQKDDDLDVFHPFLENMDSLSSNYSKKRTVEVFKFLLKEVCSKNVRLFGDKDPMNINYLPEIKQAFPGSKVIHIVRDPRDVILSRMKSDWGKGRNMIGHIMEYDYSIRKGRIDGSKLFESSYKEIRYEELLANPEKEMRNICDFLGVSFEESMLRHQDNSKDLVRGKEMSWKSNVFQPVIKSNTQKWKSELTIKDQLKLETWLSSSIVYTGYLIENKLSHWKMLLTGLMLFISRKAINVRNG